MNANQLERAVACFHRRPRYARHDGDTLDGWSGRALFVRVKRVEEIIFDQHVSGSLSSRSLVSFSVDHHPRELWMRGISRKMSPSRLLPSYCKTRKPATRFLRPHANLKITSRGPRSFIRVFILTRFLARFGALRRFVLLIHRRLDLFNDQSTRHPHSMLRYAAWTRAPHGLRSGGGISV